MYTRSSPPQRAAAGKVEAAGGQRQGKDCRREPFHTTRLTSLPAPRLLLQRLAGDELLHVGIGQRGFDDGVVAGVGGELDAPRSLR